MSMALVVVGTKEGQEIGSGQCIAAFLFASILPFPMFVVSVRLTLYLLTTFSPLRRMVTKCRHSPFSHVLVH